MFLRLYRQWRRILFLMICVWGALAIYAVNNPGLRYFLKHEADGHTVLFATLFVVVLSVFAILFAVGILCLFPLVRRSLEVVGLSAVVVEAIKRADGILPAWALEGPAPWIWFMVVYFLIATAIEKDAFFRKGLRVRFFARRRTVVAASPTQVWAALAPEAANIETYRNGWMTRVTPRLEIGPETYEVSFAAGPGTAIVQLHERLIWDIPRHFKYRFGPENVGPDTPAIRGTYEVQLEALGDGKTAVSVTHDYPAIGFGTWLLIWLDDIVASELDALKADLSGRRDWSTVGAAKRKLAPA